MLQLAPNIDIIVTDWGCSFGGSAAATPGSVELIDTGTVFATVTAFGTADVQPQNNPYAPANTSGSTGVPLGLGTALSGYTSTSEGSITAAAARRVRAGSADEPVLEATPAGPRVRRQGR